MVEVLCGKFGTVFQFEQPNPWWNNALNFHRSILSVIMSFAYVPSSLGLQQSFSSFLFLFSISLWNGQAR
jgi:hypothetical protein